jgi:hypothetical protein
MLHIAAVDANAAKDQAFHKSEACWCGTARMSAWHSRAVVEDRVPCYGKCEGNCLLYQRVLLAKMSKVQCTHG